MRLLPHLVRRLSPSDFPFTRTEPAAILAYRIPQRMFVRQGTEITKQEWMSLIFGGKSHPPSRPEDDSLNTVASQPDKSGICNLCGLDNRLRLRPVARNSMPKILNPLPVIANTNQLLRHSLGDQIITLCYQFFLGSSCISVGLFWYSESPIWYADAKEHRVLSWAASSFGAAAAREGGPPCGAARRLSRESRGVAHVCGAPSRAGRSAEYRLRPLHAKSPAHVRAAHAYPGRLGFRLREAFHALRPPVQRHLAPLSPKAPAAQPQGAAIGQRSADWLREARATGRREAQGRAESHARAGKRIRPTRRREVFRPSRVGRRRDGRTCGAFPFAPEPAAPPRRGGDRPCTCAGCWGRKPNVPHAKGLRAKDSHPPPDVHLRRGAKTSPKSFRVRYVRLAAPVSGTPHRRHPGAPPHGLRTAPR